MRKALHVVYWISIVLVVMTIAVPVLTGWFTDTFSIEAVADWFQGFLITISSQHDSSPTLFKVWTIIAVGFPVITVAGSVGALAYLGTRLLDKSDVKIQDLEQQLERFLLIYDEDYNFIGRLRSLAQAYDEARFQDLRRLVYRVVHQYCGELEDGKETFLVVEGDKALISLDNEQESHNVLENLLNVRGCQVAMSTRATQLLMNARRSHRLISTPTKWLLPNCQSFLVCPIIVGNTSRGVIGVYHNKKGAFSADVDQVFLELMAEVVSLAYTIRAKEVGK